MTAENEHTDVGGLSRRQLLARSAVVAGVVWAAPVIRSTKAYATASAGTERPCTHFYVVCVSRTDCWPTFPDHKAHLPHAWHPTHGSAGPTASQGTNEFSTGASATDVSPGRAVPVRTNATTSTSSTSTTTSTTVPTAPDSGTADPGVAPTGSPPSAGDPAGTPATQDPLGLIQPPTGPDGPDPDADTPDDTAFATTIGADIPDPIPPLILDWVHQNPDVPLEFPEVKPVVSQTSPQAWACLLPPVDGVDAQARQCKLVRGCYKNGADFGAPAHVDPNPLLANEVGRRLVFPCTGGGAGGYGGHDGHDGYLGHGPGGHTHDGSQGASPAPLPAGGSRPDRPQAAGSAGRSGDSTTSSSTTTTSSTTLPIPAPAGADAAAGARGGSHLDQHECLVLVFCCP